ncbi:hypothetical protein [Flavimaricola marinus]|uniref:Uncharacterized protein n=1 Tax=Flavimaricola marinus TaxID=1819565 RepID=A0A238LA84_9RHOB|nr:hypothetical protein [Flavimaricola marinus]SMY06325.1 hypothetical protein LOM8899_00448 [Flavimaricola marinus]
MSDGATGTTTRNTEIGADPETAPRHARPDISLIERASYHSRDRGNGLVNWRGGRSGSVAFVALSGALHEDEWHAAPKPLPVEARRSASDRIGLVDRIGGEVPAPEGLR